MQLRTEFWDCVLVYRVLRKSVSKCTCVLSFENGVWSAGAASLGAMTSRCVCVFFFCVCCLCVCMYIYIYIYIQICIHVKYQSYIYIYIYIYIFIINYNLVSFINSRIIYKQSYHLLNTETTLTWSKFYIYFFPCVLHREFCWRALQGAQLSPPVIFAM